MTTIITGCARSGTSIVGELFERHPQAHYFFEKDSLSYLNRDNAVIKNPRFVFRLPEIYDACPDVQVIYLIRDGRDVACSLRAGLEAGWKHYAPAEVQEAYDHRPVIEKGAYFWRAVVEHYSLPHLQKHILVKYEEFVQDTATVVEQLLDLTGYGPFDGMEEYVDLVQNTTEGSYHAKRQDAWYRDNHSTRIGRYQENLTPAEQEIVTVICRPMLQEFNYLEEL